MCNNVLPPLFTIYNHNELALYLHLHPFFSMKPNIFQTNWEMSYCKLTSASILLCVHMQSEIQINKLTSASILYWNYRADSKLDCSVSSPASKFTKYFKLFCKRTLVNNFHQSPVTSNADFHTGNTVCSKWP